MRFIHFQLILYVDAHTRCTENAVPNNLVLLRRLTRGGGVIGIYGELRVRILERMRHFNRVAESEGP